MTSYRGDMIVELSLLHNTTRHMTQWQYSLQSAMVAVYARHEDMWHHSIQALMSKSRSDMIVGMQLLHNTFPRRHFA